MKLFNLGRSLALALAVSMTLSIQASAQDVEIRYSNWLPNGYFLFDKVIKPWMAEVEKVTEGRVTFKLTPKPVGTVLASYDTVVDGLADASVIVPAYTVGRFIPNDGIELPWLGDNMEKRSVALWNAYENFLAPAGVFKEIKVIAMFPTNTAHIATTGKTIEKIEDLKGLKLRSPTQATTQAMELLGIVPVLKPISEVYEMASGGVIDGVATNADSVVGFKLQDVMKHMVFLDGGLAATTTMIGMNTDTWNRISEKDRQAIDAISGMAFGKVVAAANHSNQEWALGEMEKNGIKVVKASPELMQQIRDVTAPVRTGWIEQAKASGFTNAEAMLEAFQKDYDSTPSSN